MGPHRKLHNCVGSETSEHLESSKWEYKNIYVEGKGLLDGLMRRWVGSVYQGRTFLSFYTSVRDPKWAITQILYNFASCPGMQDTKKWKGTKTKDK